MNRTLKRKISGRRIVIAMPLVILTWLITSWSLLSAEKPPQPEWVLNVQKIFSGIANVIGFLFEYFALPVIALIILITAVRWSWRSKHNRLGIYLGLGLAMSLICMDRLGVFPAWSGSMAEISRAMTLICWLVSIFIGLGFLWLMGKVVNDPVYPLFIGLMTAASLCSFYLYYSSKGLEAYLLVMTLGIFVGACFYLIVFKKQKRDDA